MKNIDTNIAAQFQASIRSLVASWTAGLAMIRESLRKIGDGTDERPAPYGNITALLSHLCDHDEALRIWVLRWFAYQLRSPGAKMSTALVFNGGEGSGKTLFLRYVVAQLFHNETPWIHGRQLQNVFNDWAADGGLVIVDGPFSQAHVMQMKHYMSSADLVIHRKSRAPLTITNTLNFIYQSDAYDFSITAGSRRFTVIDVPPAREREFYHAVLHEIACGGVESFRRYLLRELDMGTFNSSTPAPAPKLSKPQAAAAPMPKGAVRWNG